MSSSSFPTTAEIESGAVEVLGPQPGPQSAFLESPADIVVYGGAAGGGKSWAILAEPLRHVDNPNFGGVIFRRTSPQITNEGGLWDESVKLYPLAGAVPSLGSLDWRFPGGANVGFRHLQHESSVLNWQGAQIAFLGFDELTHFSEYQFFYMLSRNRSTSGVRPYVRATTNPDGASWVKTFLAPWLDREFKGEGGPAESGEVRWFARLEGKITWVSADWRDPEGLPAKSVTFIRASVFDNQKLLAANPEYLSNLKSLPPLERARLLDGNWDVVANGDIFRREWFRYWKWIEPGEILRLTLDDERSKVVRLRDCRIFMTSDFAASEKTSADWTVYAVWAVTPDSHLVLLDLTRGHWPQGTSIAEAWKLFDRWHPSYVVAETNGMGLPISQALQRGVVDDEGQRGPGLPLQFRNQHRDKVARAGAAIVRLEAGTVFFPSDAPWILTFESELLRFVDENVNDDQVDNLSLAGEDVAVGGRAAEPPDRRADREAAEAKARQERALKARESRDADDDRWW